MVDLLFMLYICGRDFIKDVQGERTLHIIVKAPAGAGRMIPPPRGKHALGQVFNITVSLQAATYNTYYLVHKTSSYHKQAEYNMNKGTN